MTLGPEGVASSEGLGRAFQTFSIFGGTPGVAAAKFYSDFDLNNFQLPVTHTFEPFDGGYLDGVAPYAELTLDYLTGNQTFPLTPSPNSPSNVKLSFDAWSALAGGGFDIPLGNGFRLRPIVLAGYSHVGGDASFFGPNSALFRSLVGGVLSNASLDSALVGGAVELVYETQFPGDLTLKAQVRYNELAALVTSASSNALKQNSSFGVANASVVFSGPTDWHIASNAIRWLGYAKGTWLPNTDRADLGLQRLRRDRRRVAADSSERYPRCAGWDCTRLGDRRTRCHRLAGQRGTRFLDVKAAITPVCVGVTRRMDGS